MKVKLVEDTISDYEIDRLCDWLKTRKQLTKGPLTVDFEDRWSKRIGVKYSVFVNSGSSANFLMLAALVQQKKLKVDDIVAVPAISWATTVAPVMQLGMHPVLVDADGDSLGIDPVSFENVCKLQRPKALILVHVLGFPCKMKEIIDICKKYNVMLLEDTCESLGSMYSGKNVGTFGLMSTFSLFFGHHLSTIEGGMICTDDERTYEMLKMLRSHGWDRDLSDESKKFWRGVNAIDDFHALYTFYVPGYNMRATDLQAFLGISQLEKLPEIGRVRFSLFDRYQKQIRNDYWKPNTKYGNVFVSCFAYPIIHPNTKDIVADLQSNEIEVRPLIAGSMSKQPFFTNVYGTKHNVPFAETVHDHGIYLPLHPKMTDEHVDFISDVVNRHT